MDGYIAIYITPLPSPPTSGSKIITQSIIKGSLLLGELHDYHGVYIHTSFINSYKRFYKSMILFPYISHEFIPTLLDPTIALFNWCNICMRGLDWAYFLLVVVLEKVGTWILLGPRLYYTIHNKSTIF